MKYPPVDIVDDQDNVIGSAMVAEVWAKGHRHRGVFIVLEDNQGRILLQQRSPQMLLFPGCWDISAGGHVDTGMTYEAAAKAELAEELLLRDVPITFIGKYYTEDVMPDNRQAKVFFAVYRARLSGIPEEFGQDEVSQVRWFTPQELDELVQQHPDKVAAGLRRVYTYALAPERH